MNAIEYNVLGLMSGTSMDGLDIAHCTIQKMNATYSYCLNDVSTIEYPDNIQIKLKRSTELSANELAIFDHELGKWMGNQVNGFINCYSPIVDFIASHGHTVFHQPYNRMTLQIGNGVDIHQATQLPVIFDFRSLDVANGGQGAPLVPVGDKLLFGEYDACLNLGGFANISFQKATERIAYDICPLNIIFNFLANENGMSFDNKGALARSGAVNNEMLAKLDLLAYYKLDYPKSLGYEWFAENMIPLISNTELSLVDRLATSVEHVARQISSSIKFDKILVTGGGAFNNYLLERIEKCRRSKYQLIVPDKTLVNYKEALVFAFLGVLKVEQEVNTLKSVTGAFTDSCGGSIVGQIPLKKH